MDPSWDTSTSFCYFPFPGYRSFFTALDDGCRVAFHIIIVMAGWRLPPLLSQQKRHVQHYLGAICHVQMIARHTHSGQKGEQQLEVALHYTVSVCFCHFLIARNLLGISWGSSQSSHPKLG